MTNWKHFKNIFSNSFKPTIKSLNGGKNAPEHLTHKDIVKTARSNVENNRSSMPWPEYIESFEYLSHIEKVREEIYSGMGYASLFKVGIKDKIPLHIYFSSLTEITNLSQFKGNENFHKSVLQAYEDFEKKIQQTKNPMMEEQDHQRKPLIS